MDLPLNLLNLFSAVVHLLIRQSEMPILFATVFSVSGISVYLLTLTLGSLSALFVNFDWNVSF